MTTATSTVRPLRDGDHVVQFYDDDRELETTAFARLADAMASDDAAVVVIATPPHLDACRWVFVEAGVDVDRAVADGQLRLLDATEVLAAFLVHGRLDRSAFDRAVGDVIRAAGARRPVHAFGEMVGVLWAAGDVAGAIELEELWDALGAQLDFSLHCGYPAALMAPPSAAEGFEAVCGLHTEVLGQAPAPAQPQVCRHFVQDPRALESARRFVADTLAAWDLIDLVDGALLVVSELATNAILHGASPFTVSLSHDGSGLRLVVGDRSSTPPRRRAPDLERHGGRGLHLVDTITSEWGCDRVDGGKLVWAELAR